MEYKYVWLNLETGEFSNSWGEDDQALLEGKIPPPESTWKLIKYQCISDTGFEFYNKMKLR